MWYCRERPPQIKREARQDPCSIWFLHEYSISSHWTPPSSQSLTSSQCPTPVSSSPTPLPAPGDPCGSGTPSIQPAKALTADTSNVLWVCAQCTLGQSCTTKQTGFKLFIYLSLNLWSLQMPLKWKNLLFVPPLSNRRRLSRAQNASGIS